MARTQMIFAAVPTHGTMERPASADPRTDIVQTPDALYFTVELPGSKREALRLHFEPGQLIIEGRRERPVRQEPTRVLQMEIAYGAFRYALPLPDEADGSNIEATYEDGVLSVQVPLRMRAALPPRRVSVS